jgi:hypothetical protein
LFGQFKVAFTLNGNVNAFVKGAHYLFLGLTLRLIFNFAKLHHYGFWGAILFFGHS